MEKKCFEKIFFLVEFTHLKYILSVDMISI